MAKDPTLEDLLRSCERSALHLELRDGYMRDDPLFQAWLAGERPNPADRDSWWDAWWQLTADTAARGVGIRRTRIISEPISDYIRCEYDWTFANIAAGEQVRWLPRRQASDLALPGNDFWLFDERVVMLNHFAGDGNWTGSEVTEDPALAKLCDAAFHAVWERAIPHDAYTPA
ncbi:DUF6879 family protein [Dactylosporangium sp. NPDC049525]|uniref:DUF6879 family protein n=1 Tax=Dactylosporangium sp. NPDC049525 TaxID=3154730 RepID=UPI003417FCD2